MKFSQFEKKRTPHFSSIKWLHSLEHNVIERVHLKSADLKL